MISTKFRKKGVITIEVIEKWIFALGLSEVFYVTLYYYITIIR